MILFLSRHVRTLSLVSLTLVACGGSETTYETRHEPIGTASTVDEAVQAPVALPRCVPGGLEAASALPTITLPEGCSFTAPGTLQAPLVIANEADFAAHLHCEGAAPPIVDFTANDVLLVGHMLSPAYGGGAVLDDGAHVSFVTMERTPCPADYPPMPTPMSFAFTLPKLSARTWGIARCSLAPNCP